jgi:aminoglycoside 3-N-acetyltransferase
MPSMDGTYATRASLLNDLTRLGVAARDGLFVHASLRSIGNVVGHARAVVSALIDSVGDEGLIGMPGFSTDAYWPDFLNREAMNGEDGRKLEAAILGFDPQLSSTTGMGAIAETFRTRPGILRSSHPCVSICLHGAEADRYIAPHSLDWATGPDTPLGRLRDRPQMKILLIGVGWNRCSALHTAEALADHRRLKKRLFKASSTSPMMLETDDVADDLGRLFPAVGSAFEKEGAVTVGRIGNAESRLCSYSELVSFARDYIDNANKRAGETG